MPFLNDPSGAKQKAWDEFLASLTKEERDAYYSMRPVQADPKVRASLKIKVAKLNKLMP